MAGGPPPKRGLRTLAEQSLNVTEQEIDVHWLRQYPVCNQLSLLDVPIRNVPGKHNRRGFKLQQCRDFGNDLITGDP